MRKFGHWTPRYVGNRIRLMLYQWRRPDKPWLTPRANEILETLLLPSDVGIEWGSGRSTRWFARRLKHLTSVEHDPQWYETVKGQLKATGLTNVDYIFAADPTSDEYIGASRRFADGSLGFALVDGESREQCVLAVIPKIAPGGVLVIDNIERFLDHPTYSPESRVGQGPKNEMWARIGAALASWRCIWTSCSVFDTAIWINPGSPVA